MPRGRKTGVYGPELHHGRWRVRTHSPDGAWGSRSFADPDGKAKAQQYADAMRSEVNGAAARERAAHLRRQAEANLAEAAALEGRSMTVADAIEQRELYQRERGRQPRTIETEVGRLRAILGPVSEMALAAITESTAKKLYKARTEQESRPGKLISPGTHHHELTAVRVLWEWAIKKGHATVNPWAEVERIGKRPRGKDQLRVGESRKLHEVLVRVLAGDDIAESDRALGASLALYQGMRAEEIVVLTAREVTDDGRLIEVDEAKTQAGDRAMDVPEFLAVALAAARKRAVERGGVTAAILPFSRYWPREQAHRFCDLAGVQRVCAHALRGMHSSLARKRGVTAAAVADQLGHASVHVQDAHYTTPAAKHAATQRDMLRVIQGGK